MLGPLLNIKKYFNVVLTASLVKWILQLSFEHKRKLSQREAESIAQGHPGNWAPEPLCHLKYDCFIPTASPSPAAAEGSGALPRSGHSLPFPGDPCTLHSSGLFPANNLNLFEEFKTNSKINSDSQVLLALTKF